MLQLVEHHLLYRDLRNDPELGRKLGEIHGNSTGQVLVAIGSLHGNEPAGIRAIRQVFEKIEASGLDLNGTFIGLAGNLAAFRKDVRFVDRDLNRLWTDQFLDQPQLDYSEGAELSELKAVMDQIIAASKQPITIVDLHSFSASGSPFAISGRHPTSREITSDLPLPVVFGLSERISGTLNCYWESKGHRTIVFEGGPNQGPHTPANLESCLWIMLERCGLIETSRLQGSLAPIHMDPDPSNTSLPQAVHVKFRYRVDPEDQFIMKPGYRNFDPIQKGELLAQTRNGDVFSPETGRILMPLYQGQGSDGFFIGVEDPLDAESHDQSLGE